MPIDAFTLEEPEQIIEERQEETHRESVSRSFSAGSVKSWPLAADESRFIQSRATSLPNIALYNQRIKSAISNYLQGMFIF